jgi:hypothetical protein
MVTPDSVSLRQARLALLKAGLLSKAQALIDLDHTGEVGIWWEYASIIDRNDPRILQIGVALGLTPAQIDNLFQFASQL